MRKFLRDVGRCFICPFICPYLKRQFNAEIRGRGLRDHRIVIMLWNIYNMLSPCYPCVNMKQPICLVMPKTASDVCVH